MGGQLSQRVIQGMHRFVISTGVTGAVVGLQLTGGLQLMEWASLDIWFRLRPPETSHSRVVLVTIDEADISHLNQWPMSDATLTTVITQLNQEKPRLIGLDLYRNLPVEPGNQKLLKLFATTPNLIGIEKSVRDQNGPAIDPPPLLRERDQVAISDLVLDGDGKIRRNLLSVKSADGKTQLSLGAKTALAYLAAENITPQPLAEGKVQLGKQPLQSLQANEGGYVRADVGGFQTLANFQRLTAPIPTVSLRDVLNGQIPPGLMQGKIVLIGSVAESLRDRFYTPYTTSVETAWAGVELHANVANQLLSAALDGRGLLQGTPAVWGWGWVLLWSIVGTGLGASTRSLQRVSLIVSASLIILVSSTYLLFLGGWWIPLISPLIAITTAGLISRGYGVWQALKQSHQALEDYAKQLETKVQERTQELFDKTIVLEAAKRAAEAANFAKTSFLANMNHEFRTPLTIILGCSELLNLDPNLSAKQKEKLNSIDHSVQYLLDLINNALELAKLEAGAVTLNVSYFNLFQLLENLAAMFELQATVKGLLFTIDYQADLPPYIQTDERKLNQVLINLLSNAIKFTDSGSVNLWVGWGAEGKQKTLLFTVSDTGMGIAEAELKQVFDAFVQTESGRKSNKGSGLGLSISYQFMHLLGGNIRVNSHLGQGSQFCVELPIEVPGEPQLSTAPALSIPPSPIDPPQSGDLNRAMGQSAPELWPHSLNPVQPPPVTGSIAEILDHQTIASLHTMPPEWIAKLHRAALRLNTTKCLSLIEQMPSEAITLSHTLKDLVRNLRFDVIIDLIQQ
jgi:adenylate cyclase